MTHKGRPDTSDALQQFITHITHSTFPDTHGDIYDNLKLPMQNCLIFLIRGHFHLKSKLCRYHDFGFFKDLQNLHQPTHFVYAPVQTVG